MDTLSEDKEHSDINDSIFCVKEEPNHDELTSLYFENDYLPLKLNPDYLSLLRTLTILEAQRIKVLDDINKLENLKIRVKEDTVSTIEDVMSGNCSYRGRTTIEKVPEIDWSKYKSVSFDGRYTPSTTRSMAKQEKIDPYSSVAVENDKPESDKPVIKVRGRNFDENKPETFNQPWTVEEQLRLESLLEQFPAEPYEARRWRKIATALGNRTPQQVCSRVQKYFSKLRKHGISIPKRPPRNPSVKPRLIHKKNKHFLYRPTTFFPGVAMQEMDDSDECSDMKPDSAPDLSHWVDILTKIKEEKAKDDSLDEVLHLGYKCIGCNEEPIKGLRWECKSCPQTSLCSDCTAGLMESPDPVHPIAHQYSPVYLYVNPMYNPKSFQTTNYLDPNYV